MKVAASPDAIDEVVCSTALAVELRPASTASTGAINTEGAGGGNEL